MPKAAKADDLPLLIEAKSAGDFTNVNKRRIFWVFVSYGIGEIFLCHPDHVVIFSDSPLAAH